MTAVIQSDRYLTDAEKEQRTVRQEAERQLPMLDGTVAAEYTALKEQYPNTLVGFELNGNYLFYDKDAVAVEQILHTNLLSQENTLGKVKVTGFPSEQWVAKSKKLWAEGNNVYLAGLNEDGSHHQTKYLRESDYLPIGSIVKLDDRDFRVEHVNFMFKSVSLQDMELTKNRLPIFRNEHLPHMYDRNCVVYGGTHDNETLAGYFKPEKRQWWELQYIADYLGAAHQTEVVDKVFRTAYGSVASVVIFQVQDVLKLDNDARMNTPGTVGGNWQWRMKKDAFDKELCEKIRRMTKLYGR